MPKFFYLSFSFGSLFFFSPESSKNLDTGKELFFQHCLACHLHGNNLILPEKNLRKETLEANGMNNLPAILYQVRNGKNAMPAFGRRLTEIEIQSIASYVLDEVYGVSLEDSF